MNFRELEAQVHELIGKNELDQCIKILTEYFEKSDRLNQIILQSGQYYSVQRDHQDGTIDYSEYQKISNQLRKNILNFIKSEEEDTRFKNKVFQSDDVVETSRTIPVFFSLGTPHTASQMNFIEKLKSHLLKYSIDLRTLDDDDWDNLNPLHPICKKMESCFGCLVLAMERFHVKSGVMKRGSKQERPLEDQNFATPWSHIEATLAYQLDLPFIILKEDSLRGEGMLDDNLFEWRIVRINPEQPEELDTYPIKSFIRMWVEEVKKVVSTRK